MNLTERFVAAFVVVTVAVFVVCVGYAISTEIKLNRMRDAANMMHAVSYCRDLTPEECVSLTD